MNKNNKIIVQNEGFLYNENIQNLINQLSFSSNILQKYDNVTYNACIYMFPYDIEKQIEMDSFNGELKFGGNKNKRIILAQTGRSAKFSIESIKMKTNYGGNNPLFNGISYDININVSEMFSCMFVNQIEISSIVLGYNNYMLRPFWLDIWFSGYDPETLMPVQYIPLSNNKNVITYRGVFSNVKSNIKENSTNWNIEFKSNNHVFMNKNNNILSISPVQKFDKSDVSMQEYMEFVAEKAKERYINTFIGDLAKKEVKSLFNDNKSENDEEGGSPFLKIEIIDAKTNKNIGNDIKSGEGYSREIDKLKSSEDKSSNTEMTFVSLPQWFLARSSGIYNKCQARVEFKTKMIGCVSKREIYSTIMRILISEDPVMKNDIESSKNKTKSSPLSEEDKTNYFLYFRNNNLLCKKYIYGFSGIDTSVLEVMNNFDRLWYMNGFEYDVNKQNDSNINTVINIQEKKYSGNNDSKSDNIEKVNKNNYGEILLEDFYENIKYDVLTSDIKKINYPTMNNDLESIPLENTSQSNDENKDNETVISINSYKRLYRSGQLSTIKFKIIGDPYWLLTSSENGYGDGINNDLFKDAIKTKNYMAENYKCIFGIKNLIGQSSDALEDYSFEYSLMVSGIYSIYKCETELSDGVFTQTLYGTLDPHFITE